VIFTSAVGLGEYHTPWVDGLGEYHIPWVDKSRGQPHQKSIIVQYVPLKNFSLIWRIYYWWRAAKFRPMFGAQGLSGGRDLYRATPTVTRSVGFLVSSEGPPHLVAFCDSQGVVESLFKPGYARVSALLKCLNNLKLWFVLQCVVKSLPDVRSSLVQGPVYHPVTCSPSVTIWPYLISRRTGIPVM
jgi:hypothetical protein